MLTSIRGIMAATISAGIALSATPALAENNEPTADQVGPALEVERSVEEFDIETTNNVGGESGFELSGNVAMVTDYRFRGVSFSDGDIALQGGIDLAHSSGLYIGTWASTISGGSPYGELELDVYAGWSGDVSDGVTFDVGLLYYIYPTENEFADALDLDTDYFEPYASIGTTLGPVGATLGVAYAWDQSSLGDEDNLYIYTDLEAGIPDTPVTFTAHLGYTDGVFATQADGSSFDWGLGVSYAVTENLSLGFDYVDTQGPSFEDFTDAGFLFTIGYSM
ncbi:MAG TPA: hypothetical protein DCS24_09250 [Erythrobacter sp.]|nr:hypothetical protein [Erythrobacter sp.]